MYKLIDKYLGVPYKLHGRDLKGLDCYGLIIKVYEDLGYKILDIEEDYDEKWSWRGRNHFIENYHKEWEKVQAPTLYDVIMFKNGKDIVNHAGIIISSWQFLHTCKAGTIVSNYERPEWLKRFDGFYHLKARDDNFKILT